MFRGGWDTGTSEERSENRRCVSGGKRLISMDCRPHLVAFCNNPSKPFQSINEFFHPEMLAGTWPRGLGENRVKRELSSG